MNLRVCPWLGLSSLMSLACSAGDGAVTEPDGSENGGSSGNGSLECSAAGIGTLTIEVVGLPDELEPEIELSGPGALGVAEPGIYPDLPAGLYAVSAARVTDFDPIVRTVYEPTVASASGCVVDGGELAITIEYSANPSSNKLWLTSGADVELVAFGSADLAESAALDAPVAIDAPAGRDVAFDRDGNLWTFGPTVADPMLVRFDAILLGDSAEVQPSLGVDVPQITCLPALRAMAFDPDGNLWLSTCDEQVMRLEPDQLNGEAETDVVISSFTANQGLAFDSAGNLWVADDGLITRYDAGRLDAADAEPADLILSVSDAPETRLLAADMLAFDQAGNLWATDFVSNFVFMVGAANLEGTGVVDVAADVSVAIGVTALLEGLAFDESNALWIILDSERFGMLSAEQLGESSGSGAPTEPAVIIQSSSITNAGGLAFFPAPAGLPLYHALPQ